MRQIIVEILTPEMFCLKIINNDLKVGYELTFLLNKAEFENLVREGLSALSIKFKTRGELNSD